MQMQSGCLAGVIAATAENTISPKYYFDFIRRMEMEYGAKVLLKSVLVPVIVCFAGIVLVGFSYEFSSDPLVALKVTSSASDDIFRKPANVIFTSADSGEAFTIFRMMSPFFSSRPAIENIFTGSVQVINS